MHGDYFYWAVNYAYFRKERPGRWTETILRAGVEQTNTPILVNSNPFELDTATSHAPCQSSTFKATSSIRTSWPLHRTSSHLSDLMQLHDSLWSLVSRWPNCLGTQVEWAQKLLIWLICALISLQQRLTCNNISACKTSFVQHASLSKLYGLIYMTR